MEDDLKKALRYYRGTELGRNVYRTNSGMDDSAHVIANAYLAEHPADDDTPIDEAWLKASGFAKVVKEPNRYFQIQIEPDFTFLSPEHRKDAVAEGRRHYFAVIPPQELGERFREDGFSMFCSWLPCIIVEHEDAMPIVRSIRTRGDLRRLCSALGVTLSQPGT